MDGHDVIEPAIVGTDPAMRPFVAHEFSAVFHEYTGIPVDDLYSAAHDAVFSTLLTENGSPQQIDLQEVPAYASVVPPSVAAKCRDDPRGRHINCVGGFLDYCNSVGGVGDAVAEVDLERE